MTALALLGKKPGARSLRKQQLYQPKHSLYTSGQHKLPIKFYTNILYQAGDARGEANVLLGYFY